MDRRGTEGEGRKVDGGKKEKTFPKIEGSNEFAEKFPKDHPVIP